MEFNEREAFLLNLLCEEQKETYTNLICREGVREHEIECWRERIMEIEKLQTKINATNKQVHSS
jgi:hypothetical protein